MRLAGVLNVFLWFSLTWSANGGAEVAARDGLATVPEQAVTRRAALDPYTGLVSSQTATVAGSEFSQHFMVAWRERDTNERYAMSIYERPSARFGTRIAIEYAQRLVFQAQLPAARASVKALAEHAANAVFEKVAAAEVERLLVRDADMGPDEI